jgi:hypothetical protein
MLVIDRLKMLSWQPPQKRPMCNRIVEELVDIDRLYY